MKIIPLSEGAFTVDQSKKFVPFQLDKDDLQERSKGSLLVEIQPFCVITSRDILILDTGLGFAGDNHQMQIHKNLALNGISPSDVTKVLLSHLHKDHSGGIAKPGKKEVSFENANYFINSREWDFAFEKGFPSYITDDFLLLKDDKRLHLIEGSGIIDEYIHYEETGGHSPYHQVFMIEDNDEKIFYGGDVAPQLQQMKNRFKAKYDFDGAKAMELRVKWWQQGERENWTFLFYHDIKYPFYKS
ncbi:MAG: MBL fold metallo-hydrolase [Bacteroidota bacterium]|nr:MBL fold metallo-hydrolase [Bacteroidota bacterium]